jgi:hypothetical protein
MKIENTIIVAFLVSVGALSSAQAIKYVSTISHAEKAALVSVIQVSGPNVGASAGACDESCNPIRF